MNEKMNTSAAVKVHGYIIRMRLSDEAEEGEMHRRQHEDLLALLNYLRIHVVSKCQTS